MCCSPAPVPELRPGQRWLPTVRLRQPHGTLNPQVFDLELWLFEQCIRASGTVRATAAAVNRKLADAADHPVERVRQAVRDAILLRVTDAQAARGAGGAGGGRPGGHRPSLWSRWPSCRWCCSASCSLRAGAGSGLGP
jgi:hypothetical protein